jgi:biotin operon repressor
MANQFQSVTPAMRREIAKLSKQGLSSREVGRRLKIDHTVVLRHKGEKHAPLTPEQLEDSIRKALRVGHKSGRDLAEELGVSAKKVHCAIALMRARGVMITDYPGDVYEITTTAALEPGRHVIKGDPRAEWTHHFLVLSDNHLCNRNSRLDVLNAAYDYAERNGISIALNAGNYIDGEARFNKTELIVAPGMDNQMDYMIQEYPHRKGIKTLFIDGDDHEGWYAQREGILPGQYLQMKAEKAGRNDLEYLGYSEADIALKCGSGESVARVLHPGGGSAYATSYTAQKIVESYQGGEKPAVIFIGHYHKAEYGYPREVHCLQTATTEDQSLFMRKKKIAAHLGFWNVRIKQNARGIITDFLPHFHPFYDRGFYARRFE